MYIPKFNEETHLPILHDLIKSKPLGAWSAMAGGEIVVNHIPFLLHKNRGEFGTLAGHVARANTVWKDLSRDLESVVVFQGEQAYITPSWYPGKQEHRKVVPTWNYVVVHARGVPRCIEDAGWLIDHLNELTDVHEKEKDVPWRVSDAPAEFIDRLLDAIVGIEIPITRITGKWKLGQNRPADDQTGMLTGLRSTASAEAMGLADRLSQHMQSSEKIRGGKDEKRG